MKTISVVACILILAAGCKTTASSGIPSRHALLAAASGNGKYDVTIDRYDPETRTATVVTPGWQPVRKPYQFDGNRWVPLWSPYAAPQLKPKTK